MRISDWSSDVCSSVLVVNAAISLRPLLQENAAKGDVQRYPAPEVIAAFDKADLWAVAVPQRLGGRGVSATALVRMGAELAKGDPSAAWVSQIINGTTWVTSLGPRSEEHTSELQSLMRISYAVFCLKKKKTK